MLLLQKTVCRNAGRPHTDRRWGDWYTIGLALGIGTALGVLLAGLLSATAPVGRIAAIVLAGAQAPSSGS